MRYARKKRTIVTAYQLGANTPMEEELVREGAIQRLPDGGYALFSQEAVHGIGELAQAGDYFKVDTVGARHYPYPNRQGDFETSHRHLQGDTYEQISEVLAVWQEGDDPCEEMDFLLASGRLTLHPEDEKRYFNAVLWDAPLSAPREAVIVFYRVERNSLGCITDVVFNFVGRREFEQGYILLSEQQA